MFSLAVAGESTRHPWQWVGRVGVPAACFTPSLTLENSHLPTPSSRSPITAQGDRHRVGKPALKEHQDAGMSPSLCHPLQEP